jgi:hypothetical protein
VQSFHAYEKVHLVLCIWVKSPEKLSAPECPIAEQTEQTILLLFTKEYHIVHIVAGMRDSPQMQN